MFLPNPSGPSSSKGGGRSPATDNNSKLVTVFWKGFPGENLHFCAYPAACPRRCFPTWPRSPASPGVSRGMAPPPGSCGLRRGCPSRSCGRTAPTSALGISSADLKGKHQSITFNSLNILVRPIWQFFFNSKGFTSVSLVLPGPLPCWPSSFR